LLDEFGKVMRQDRGRREGVSTALAYSSGMDGWMHITCTQLKHIPLKKRIEMCTFHSTEEWWFALST
jgi:hypothetical protein